ncbi:MAG: phage capsid protein [Oscillospiraceae bacterium]|nr:phage capsid protein [Oscillospiraceae bacterium]
MAITLAEAKVGMADKVDQQIVDMFRRSSLLLDKMVFDNVIAPGTGGSTLTYGYIQLKSPATASVRTIGNEYTPGEAKKEKKTANAIIMGGSFQMDRVIQNTTGAANEMAFQAEQKIKATANYFHNLVINGTGDATGAGYVTGTFDGLKKLLTGTANEITSQVSLTTSTELDSNYNAFLDEMDSFISCLDGTPSMLLMNRAMLVKLRSIARRAGYYERSQDDFGRTVETYAGVPMVDMGQYYNGTTVQDVVETDATTGKTAIYAVSLGLDGFHGISPMGDGVVQSYLPDLNAPGAVKTGEVELVAGVVLKNTLKAAVLKDIAIAAVADND